MKTRTYDEALVAAAMQEARCAAQRIIRDRRDFPESEQEDIAQELITEVLLKAHRFDPNRSSARTFVSAVMRSKILKLLRSRRCENRNIRIVASLHEEVHDGEGWVAMHETMDHAGCADRGGQGEPDLRRTVELKADMEPVLAGLTPRQRRICELLPHESKSTIAARLAITRMTLHREIEAIREAFDKAGLDDYLAGNVTVRV